MLLSPLVEGFSEGIPGSENALLVRVFVDLASVVEQHIVRLSNGRLKFKLLGDASCLSFDFFELWHFQDKVDSILLMVLSDFINFVLLSKLLKEVLVISSPLPNRKLSDFEFIIVENIVDAADTMLTLYWLYIAGVSFVPRPHGLVRLSSHNSSDVLDDTPWTVLRNKGAPACTNTFCSVDQGQWYDR